MPKNGTKESNPQEPDASDAIPEIPLPNRTPVYDGAPPQFRVLSLLQEFDAIPGIGDRDERELLTR